MYQHRDDGSRVKTKTKENRVVVLGDDAAQAVQVLDRGRKEVFVTPTGKPLRPNSLRYYWLPVRTAFEGALPMDHWVPRRLRQDRTTTWTRTGPATFSRPMLADRRLSARDIAAQFHIRRIGVHVYFGWRQDHADDDRTRRWSGVIGKGYRFYVP